MQIPSTDSHRSKRAYLFVFVTLIATLIIYWPGLSGGFIFDDGNSITQNRSVHIDQLNIENLLAAAYSRDTGPLKRPISMASFAINHAMSGLSAFYFKLTNVIIHLCNGLLLFLLLRCVLRQWYLQENQSLNKNTSPIYMLPAFVTAAWLLHPLNVSSVLYVVQRMNELAALFSLLGMLLYCLGRERLLADKSGGKGILVIALLLPGTLGILSKENGALLPLFLLIIEACVYQFRTNTSQDKKFLIGYFLLFVVLPLSLILLAIFVDYTRIIGSYNNRPFTLYERLLSETRILFFYLQQILIPQPSTMGLFHDGYELSRGLLQPDTTIAAIIAHLILITTALFLIHRHAIPAFCILWFYVAHSMESTVFPLEPVFEHRNYLAMVGPLLLLIFAIFKVFTYPSRKAYIVSSIILIIFSASLIVRVLEWSDPIRHVLSEVKNHPQSSRANDFAGMIYETAYKQTENKSNLEMALNHYNRATLLNSNMIESLISTISLVENKPDRDAAVKELKIRLKKSLPHSSWLSALEKLIQQQPEHVNVDSVIKSLLENPRVGKGRAAEVYNLLAMNADRQNQTEQAGEYIQEARRLYPENILFHLGYAHWLRTQNCQKEALKVLDEAEQYPMRISMKVRVNTLREELLSDG